MGMAVAGRRGKEPIAAGVLGGKSRDEIGTDLVILLPDHGAQRRAYLIARSAELLHRFDRRLGDAGERAAPAGMRRAHDPSPRIGEKDRTAIGRADADREAAFAGDDRVGARARGRGPRRVGDNDVRRVNLVDGEQMVRIHRQGCCHACAILGNMVVAVVRTDAAVEA